ncbi:hypothetical protein J2793_000443 [Paraburkholderia caledonica]|uniref:Uncharacterized protein n=1 Tax=Paraburkholderia caledonica TaxID=134536 RepID=A0AB73I4U4_9BURK|nr:hypothetical protein [Paraburkholderia caledonica]
MLDENRQQRRVSNMTIIECERRAPATFSKRVHFGHRNKVAILLQIRKV